MANVRPQTNVATPQAPRQRILRIGILLGGKIVEERLIRERMPVSIGQSMKNTFSIPVEGLPLEFTLFALDQNRYSLRFLNKMDGRLSDGGNVNTLDALKGRGAQNVGDYWQVPLSDTSRGKLSLGDLTILFQFVTEPPRQPKPMLPASVRGTFADRLDPRLSVILAASLIINFTIVIIAKYVIDVELPNTVVDRAYNLTFKQDTYNVDVTPPQPAVAAQTQGQGSAAKPEPAKPVSKPAPAKKNDTGGRDAKADIAMQEDQARAMADLLTGEGPNGDSQGDMSKRRPGADLGTEIEAVKEGGKKVEVGGGSGRGSRGNGDPRVGTGHGPAIHGPGGTELAGGGKGEEHAPTGRISIATKQAMDETNLTPDAVLAKIMAAYMAGIKRCYTQYLKKDGSARGKVLLSFTVNETGRSTEGSAHGFSSEVDECIGGMMSTWRFPIPKDKDGDATTAQFAITLQLVPD